MGIIKKSSLNGQYKHNFDWPYIWRWQCSIHKGSLKTSVWLSMNYKVYILENSVFTIVVSLHKWL